MDDQKTPKISLEGTVTDISRGNVYKTKLTTHIYVNQARTIDLTVNSSGEERIISIPAWTNTEFELLPYREALLGQEISYRVDEKFIMGEGTHDHYALEVLSGTHKGLQLSDRAQYYGQRSPE